MYKRQGKLFAVNYPPLKSWFMLVYISRNALSPRHKTGADESDDRYGKKDPQGPRNALYDLDADIIGVDQLDKGDEMCIRDSISSPT